MVKHEELSEWKNGQEFIDEDGDECCFVGISSKTGNVIYDYLDKYEQWWIKRKTEEEFPVDWKIKKPGIKLYWYTELGSNVCMVTENKEDLHENAILFKTETIEE